VAGLFLLAARPLNDPDLWWHLRTGELIIQNHKLFHSDPYSFTRAGQPWVDHEWLSEILIFALYKAAGWGGLIVGFAAVIACTFLLVFVRCSGQPYIAGAITVWGAIAAVPSFGVRPQMITLLLASIFLFVLEQSYERPNRVWWLLPLMLLWVNLHAGYAVGLGLVAVYLCGDLLDSGLGNFAPEEWPGRARNLSRLTLACVAIVPLNPYAIAMYRYPIETLRSRAMLAYIGEWASPDFHQGRYVPVLLLMLGVMMLPALSSHRLRARELLLLAVGLYAALRSVRHIPLFVLIAAPLLSGMIQGILKEAGRFQVFERERRPAGVKLALNLVLLTSFLLFSGFRVRYVIRHQTETTDREFPSSALNFIASARLPAPVMNHYNWGGYFIWKLYPEYKVYIDGRADVYGDAFMDQFASTYYARGEHWRAGLEKWNVQTILLPPDAPVITALSIEPGWQRVFSDSEAIVLTRR